MQARTVVHSTQATNLAEILERVLDKGVVIAGDVRIKLLDIEILTLQLRLVIASVDKAKELGIDWWQLDPFLSSKAGENGKGKEIEALKQRVEELEALQAPKRPGQGRGRKGPKLTVGKRNKILASGVVNEEGQERI